MFSNIQEQEEYDYRMGCFNNESQAAFTLSQLTQEYPREMKRVEALVAQGRFVIALHYPVFCVHTDALLGQATKIISDHNSHDEAYEACQGLADDDGQSYEFWYAIYPQERPVQPIAASAVEDSTDPNDIPF